MLGRRRILYEHRNGFRMLRNLSVILLGALVGACATLHEKTLHEKTLANGLRVIVQEDHRSPVVVSQLWYKVGSIDEPEGLTGLSHVLEHMMFKGTQRLGPNEFSRIVAAHGGRENAFTGPDYTGYYEQLERSRFAIGFELEAERMQHLALAPEEFGREIKVVMEERRLRTDDNPDGLLSEKFMSTAFQVHPYKHPIIGWMRDLERLTVDDARRWYEQFYAPNNAALVVVGDVQPREVFALAEQYFGPIPRRDVKRTAIPTEPPQLQERRTRVAAPAEVPQLLLGYHVPVITPQDSWEPYALSVAAGVLGGGNAARFARELVREHKIAVAADVGYDPLGRAPDIFYVNGTPAPGRTVAELEQALRGQIARLREARVTDEELRRIKAQVVARDVYARDSMFYQAMRLGQLATIGLDLRLPQRYVERINAVSAEQVQAVARKYLTDSNLTVAVLEPQPIEGGARRIMPGRPPHVR